MCKIDLSEKLTMLEPDEKTIGKYKGVEVGSLDRLHQFLDGGDAKFNQAALQMLKAVGNVRRTLRASMTIRAQIFKDISKNPKELRMYIRATFPKMLKR